MCGCSRPGPSIPRVQAAGQEVVTERKGDEPSFRSNGKPLILAHRGLTTRAPENTVAAVQAALDLGADGVEVDLQVTADGEVVVFHDDDLARLAGRKGKVRDHTLAELEKMEVLDVATGEATTERISGLDAFLDRFGGKCFLFLELKTPGGPRAGQFLKKLVQKVETALVRRDLLDSTLVSSLDVQVLRELGRACEEVRSVFEFFPPMKALEGLPVDFPPDLPPTRWIGPNYMWITRDRVVWARNHYEGISVFTPNILEDQIHLMECGVDLIQTDAPRLALLCRERKLDRDGLRRLHMKSARGKTVRWPEASDSFRGKVLEGGVVEVDFPAGHVLTFQIRAVAEKINFVRMDVERLDRGKGGAISFSALEEGEVDSPGMARMALTPVGEVLSRGCRSWGPHLRFLSLPEAGRCEASVTIIPDRRTRSLFISVGTDTPGRFRLHALKTGVIEP